MQLALTILYIFSDGIAFAPTAGAPGVAAASSNSGAIARSGSSAQGLPLSPSCSRSSSATWSRVSRPNLQFGSGGAIECEIALGEGREEAEMGNRTLR